MGNQKQADNKMKKVITWVCVILAAVLVVGLTVYTQLYDKGVILRSKTAAESDNYKVSGTMMAYFYNSNYQQYAQYLSMLGVDTTQSLKTQECPYATGGTWFDYFTSMTEDYVTHMLALCEGAKEAGVELDDEDKASIDETLETLKSSAESAGYTINQYLTALTGAGVNLKDVGKCLELSALASKYSTKFQDELTYTDEELEAYAEENPDEFNGVDYYVYTVNSSDFMEEDSDGNPVGDTSTASASAYEAAQKIAEADGVDSYISAVREYMTDTLAMEEADVDEAVESAFNRHALSSYIASVSDWAFSASEGDIYMSGEEGDSSFAIYCLAKSSYRDETQNRNVRHILFSTDNNDDDTAAQKIYAEWAESGYSEDKFIELANANSDDTGSNTNGGLYENVTYGSMTTEFNDWLFDESRQPGDHDIVETYYGWHIMYYVGEGEGNAWQSTAESSLKSNDFSEMVEAHETSVKCDTGVLSDLNV